METKNRKGLYLYAKLRKNHVLRYHHLGEHDYRKTATYPPEFARLRCKMCDDEKPLSANAKLTGRGQES